MTRQQREGTILRICARACKRACIRSCAYGCRRGRASGQGDGGAKEKAMRRRCSVGAHILIVETKAAGDRPAQSYTTKEREVHAATTKVTPRV